MDKLVSIIIPTKNNGDILEKSLASIKNLDYPKDKIEVIIVDGHSTDDTVEIAKKYGCKVVCMKILEQLEERGISELRMQKVNTSFLPILTVWLIRTGLRILLGNSLMRRLHLLADRTLRRRMTRNLRNVQGMF